MDGRFASPMPTGCAHTQTIEGSVQPAERHSGNSNAARRQGLMLLSGAAFSVMYINVRARHFIQNRSAFPE